MQAAMPNKYQGLWQRISLEEPTGEVIDTADKGTLVFWLQTDSWYVDFRSVVHEGKTRGFGGECKLISKDGQDVLTWSRYMDTAPEFLPSGIDSAVAVLKDEDTLIEDGGEEYREVWKRVKKFDEKEGSNKAVVKATKDHILLKIDEMEIESKRINDDVIVSYKNPAGEKEVSLEAKNTVSK